MARLNDVLENLISQYEGYFNIEKPHSFGGEDILAYAHYTQRISKYVLMRSAELYAMQTNEHVFMVHKSRLDNAAWQFEKNRIVLAEKDYVVPNSEHMFSYMTLILLCDAIDTDTVKPLSRFKHTKYYKHSIHGYSTVRIAALELPSERIITNPRAKEVRQVLEKALHM